MLGRRHKESLCWPWGTERLRYNCVAQPCITQPFVKIDILGHNVEVVRNHETEEGGSVKLREGLKAYGLVKGYFGTDTRPIESRFPAQ